MKGGEKVTSLGDFRERAATSLLGLTDELEAHNQQHSAGASLGKTLGRFLTPRPDDTNSQREGLSESRANVIFESAQSARIGLAELTTKYEQTLQRSGLSIAHEQSEGLRHGIPSGPIVMTIEDASTFLRYLKSLESLQHPDRRAANAVKMFLNVTVQQAENIDFENLLPRDRGLLESLSDFAEAFKKIAPGLDITQLENYAQFQASGRLENYLVVNREGLWQEPGKGFGPGDWVRDILASSLDHKWGHALDVLHEQDLLHNSGVGQELRAHLIRCIKHSREILSSIQYWDADKKKDLREVLEKYEPLLEKGAATN